MKLKMKMDWSQRCWDTEERMHRFLTAKEHYIAFLMARAVMNKGSNVMSASASYAASTIGEKYSSFIKVLKRLKECNVVGESNGSYYINPTAYFNGDGVSRIKAVAVYEKLFGNCLVSDRSGNE